MTTEPDNHTPDTLTALLTTTLRNYGPALAVMAPEEIARTLVKALTHAGALTSSDSAYPYDSHDPDNHPAHTLANQLETHILLDLYFPKSTTTFEPDTTDEEAAEGVDPEEAQYMIRERVAADIAHNLGHHLTHLYHLIPRTPKESTDTP